MKPRTKLTLGGKLTLVLASLWLALWLLVVAAGEAEVAIPGTVGDTVGLSLIVLSHPIASLSGALEHGHGAPPGKMLAYLILMGPNLFLWGYALSGLVRLIGHVSGRTDRLDHPKAVEQKL